MPSEVLVVGEMAGGQISPTTRELLAAGRQLADESGSLLAVGLPGTALEEASSQAIAAGADKVYAVEHSLLAEYQVDLHLTALDSLCRQVEPRIVLVARSNSGRELAPRLAARLGVGLAQDCLEVKWDADGQRLLANRELLPPVGTQVRFIVERLRPVEKSAGGPPGDAGPRSELPHPDEFDSR